MRVFPSDGVAACVLTAIVTVLCLASPFLLSSCKRNESRSSLQMQHEINPLPPHVGSATVTLKLSNGSGGPVQGASIRLEGNMTHPGMSPAFSNAEETGPGEYRAPLEFSMSGDWVVVAHITLPSGEKIEKQFDVRGVRSN
jgi:hypothetical protein